jgi:hypothetical protein
VASGLGVLIVFLGYSTLYYGLTQIQGGNWGFLDLTWPGRWSQTKVEEIPKDGQKATK